MYESRGNPVWDNITNVLYVCSTRRVGPCNRSDNFSNGTYLVCIIVECVPVKYPGVSTTSNDPQT